VISEIFPLSPPAITFTLSPFFTCIFTRMGLPVVGFVGCVSHRFLACSARQPAAA
jgi:hypothetical protein